MRDYVNPTQKAYDKAAFMHAWMLDYTDEELEEIYAAWARMWARRAPIIKSGSDNDPYAVDVWWPATLKRPDETAGIIVQVLVERDRALLRRNQKILERRRA